VTHPAIETWLVRYRPDLVRFVRAHGGRVLRFETAEDLTQGVHLRALDRSGGFEPGDERVFLAWMYKVARSYVADRRLHWSALKRNSGSLLRLTAASDATTDPRAVVEPAPDVTGPSTFASRREQMVLAVRALSLLLERDRQIVRGHCDGLTISDLATRLGLKYDATRIAHARALERFRNAYTLLARS